MPSCQQLQKAQQLHRQVALLYQQLEQVEMKKNSWKPAAGSWNRHRWQRSLLKIYRKAVLAGLRSGTSSAACQMARGPSGRTATAGGTGGTAIGAVWSAFLPKGTACQLMEALPAAANPDELSALKAQLEDSLSRLQQQIEQLIPAAKVSQPRYFDREYLSNQILPMQQQEAPTNAHWNCCIRSRLPLPNSWALPISSRLTEQSSWKSS